MMNRKKVITNSIYLIGIIVSILGFHFFCSDIKLICICSFGILLYQLIKDNTQLGKVSFFHALGIMAVVIFVEILINKKQTNRDFLLYGGWKTIAIIEKKTNYRGDNWRLDIRYLTRTNIELKVKDNCPNKKIYNSLNVGDTIIIVHSNKDVSDYRINKYFPTHNEIKEYKNGRTYEPKNQKK